MYVQRRSAYVLLGQSQTGLTFDSTFVALRYHGLYEGTTITPFGQLVADAIRVAQKEEEPASPVMTSAQGLLLYVCDYLSEPRDGEAPTFFVPNENPQIKTVWSHKDAEKAMAWLFDRESIASSNGKMVPTPAGKLELGSLRPIMAPLSGGQMGYELSGWAGPEAA